MYVIGTAGHVDHGKTRLVEALTGINTDQLPEEKQRGLTIDLGFAHFEGEDGVPIGVVDVPGHERFIRNMVAGAWSVDCALLVVAANEGWMPQSTDHVRVLSCLRIPRVIVVVTKGDLVDNAVAESVGRQAVERCSAIGGWQCQSVIVSALRGSNIAELKSVVDRELALVRREEPGAPYLYVDRVFTVSGAGRIVTGSLRGGELVKGCEATVEPQSHKVRIRSIQSYYQELEKAGPVSRVALNLVGARVSEIKRGCCVVLPDSPIKPEREFVARIVSPGPAGNEDEPKLKNHSEIEIALGTGHGVARVHILPNPTLVRVVLNEPMPVMWGQRFLIMQRGGSRILSGGSVFWFGETDRRTRNSLSTVFERLEKAPADLLHLEVLVRGTARRRRHHMISVAGEPGYAVMGDWVFDETRLTAWKAAVLEELRASGRAGVGDLARRICLAPDALQEICDDLVRTGVILRKGSVLYPASVSPEDNLSPLAKTLLSDLTGAAGAGVERGKLRMAGALQELRNLARLGLAVSLDGDIYYSKGTYESMVKRVTGGLGKGSALSIGQVRERTGLSRKYVIPLLNRMEADGLVRREGDLRTLQ